MTGPASRSLVVRRAAVALCGALGAGALAWPGAAAAHGLAVRDDIPIPAWLFVWGAAVVLVVSFVGLATLWPTPRLQQDTWRPLPARFSRVLTSRGLELVCGATGFGLLVLVVYSGYRGVNNAGENFAPTFVYITFWLGLVPLSVLFGDVFRAFNPWVAAARAVAWTSSKAAGESLPAPLKYPEALGRWPAVLGILAFGWLELAANGGDGPRTVATATVIYSAVTWTAMAMYGVDRWAERGEAFSVYFNLFSRLSVFERRGDAIGRRRLLSGAAHWPPLPGSVAFVCTLIGVVTFDGFSNGATWSSWIPDIQDLYESLGLDSVRALEATFGTGLLATVALTGGFYLLGIRGMRSIGGGHTVHELASTFAHSLAPIALVYAAAHYVSFLLLQGQAIIPLASDPLGGGSDLLGTASVTVNYGLLSARNFWYLQVGFVVLGHVAALVLAHDRAITVYDDSREAVRSQYWMLVVMIGFTSLALWLLSEAIG